MEKKIQEIMDNNIFYGDMALEEIMSIMKSAKEIADHIKEFILWLEFGEHLYYPENVNIWTKYDEKTDQFSKPLNIDEIYNIWLTQIKGK